MMEMQTMITESENEMWLAMERLGSALRACPSIKRKAMRAFAELTNSLKIRDLAVRLLGSKHWREVPPMEILSMDNRIDEPFLRLMLRLSRWNVCATSMLMMWRRLKALDRQSIISYFNIQCFSEEFEYGALITGSDVLRNCVSSKELLEDLQDSMDDSKLIEDALRAKLGISSVGDIEEAWKRFAKLNHPDKGGNIEVFVTTMAAYQEWKDSKNHHK